MNTIEKLTKNQIYTQLNKITESLITSLKNELQKHYTIINVNLSFYAINGNISVDIICDDNKISIIIGNKYNSI